MAYDWNKRQAELAKENAPRDYKIVFYVALILMLFTVSEFRHIDSEAKSTRNFENRIGNLSRKLDEANNKIRTLQNRTDYIAVSR